MIGQSEQHLTAAGEGYGEHFGFAATVGLMAIAAGLACMVRAPIPALCARTRSTIVARLLTLFAQRRMLDQVAEQSSDALTFVGLLRLSGVAPATPIFVGAQLDSVGAPL